MPRLGDPHIHIRDGFKCEGYAHETGQYTIRLSDDEGVLCLTFPTDLSALAGAIKLMDAVLTEDLRHQAERDRVAGQPRVEKVGV